MYKRQFVVDHYGREWTRGWGKFEKPQASWHQCQCPQNPHEFWNPLPGLWILVNCQNHISSPLYSQLSTIKEVYERSWRALQQSCLGWSWRSKLLFEDNFWPICYLLSETMWSWRYKLSGWWHVECPRVLPVRRTLQIRYPVRMTRQHHSRARNTSALIGTASAHPPQLGSQHLHACCEPISTVVKTPQLKHTINDYVIHNMYPLELKSLKICGKRLKDRKKPI